MIHTEVQVLQKYAVNHDCIRMKLNFIKDKFDIKIGQSIMINVHIKNQKYPQGLNVSRKYSIISPSTQKDWFEILFKVYRSCQQYPQGGDMTQYLQNQVHIGSILNIQGPFSRFQYFGNGKTLISTSLNKTLDDDEYNFKKIFIMAGGSGITPCFQTLRQIVSRVDDSIQLQLLFANKTQEDIILRKQLQELEPRIKIDYIIEKSSQTWKGFTGLVTTELIEKLCILNDSQTLYIHCGPIGMTKVIIFHFMKNYPKMKLFKF